MKRWLIVCLLLAGQAYAEYPEVTDIGGSDIVGSVLQEFYNGDGSLTVLGISDGNELSGSHTGILRFWATTDELYHYDVVYYSDSNCPSVAGDRYFKIPHNPDPISDITAEGRRAIDAFREWEIETSGPTTAPTVRSMRYPLGFCQNITAQALPSPLSDWRKNTIAHKQFFAPFEIRKATEAPLIQDNNDTAVGSVYELTISNGLMNIVGISGGHDGGAHDNESGVFRFLMREGETLLAHHSRIYFSNASCNISGQVYFEIEHVTTNHNSPIYASLRRAIHKDVEYVLSSTVPSGNPTTMSYIDPFGSCVTQTQPLPSPNSNYRQVLSSTRAYTSPFVVN